MKQNLKYFNMLEFKPHPIKEFSIISVKRATIFFNNGYGASVITSDMTTPFGKIVYTDEKHPYELAILEGNEEDFDICYDTYLTDDVIGYCDAEKINDLLKKISKLARRFKNE